MIRVLRIINRFNLGGPTYNATYLTAYLSDEYETKLIGGAAEKHEGTSDFIPQHHGVEIEIVKEMQRSIALSKDLKAIKKIRKIIRDYKPDVVHTHASKAGFIGRYAAYKEGVPAIVHTFHGHVFHSYFGALKTNFYKNIERFLAKRSDAIIAISDIQKQELCVEHKIAPESKVHVIPLGFDLDRFRNAKEQFRQAFRHQYEIGENDVVIGIVGRLTAIKNHHLLFKAVEKIASRTNESVKVIVIGDGELKEELMSLAQEIESRTQKSLFIFTSWIKAIETVLPALDIVALSSLNEGTPVSLIEAQAASIPVISTNVGGVRNVIDDGVTGVIVDSFEVEDYAKSLLTLVESEEKREKMSQNGWNHVQDKFHYKQLCSDVEQLYAGILKKKKV